MDLTFQVNQSCFNYRVGAICKHDNKILMLQNEGEDFWYVPGGRVQLLETSEVAIKKRAKRRAWSRCCSETTFMDCRKFLYV